MAICDDRSLPLSLSIESDSPAEITLVETAIRQRHCKDFLHELSETKLTILILTTSIYDDDLESNLLLPTSAIAKSQP